MRERRPPDTAFHAARVARAAPATGWRQRWHAIAPALGLFFLSPLVAEYLLGNIAIDALAGLVVLAPLYGGGALLIREVTRRTGRGWPTALLLALAYAVFEEGLVTQSLFDPGYVGANLLSVTYLPALGIGVWWTVFVLTLHTVWSITVPIALVESYVPQRAGTPWLGNVGLAVTVALLIVGAVASFAGTYQQSAYLAPAPQLIGATVAIVALIAVAFAIPTHPRPPLPGQAPNPWLVGVFAFVMSSLFMVARWFIDTITGWGVVAVYLLIDAIVIVLVARWSRHPGWSTAHVLALAGGALLTYAWHAFPEIPVLGQTGTIDRIGNAVFAIGALLALAAAIDVQRKASHAARSDDA